MFGYSVMTGNDLSTEKSKCYVENGFISATAIKSRIFEIHAGHIFAPILRTMQFVLLVFILSSVALVIVA